MKSNTQTKIDEAKNWNLRKSFLMRRVIKPNNVLDRSKKFVIEDLYNFPKAQNNEGKVEEEGKRLKRKASAPNIPVSEFKQKNDKKKIRNFYNKPESEQQFHY